MNHGATWSRELLMGHLNPLKRKVEHVKDVDQHLVLEVRQGPSVGRAATPDCGDASSVEVV